MIDLFVKFQEQYLLFYKIINILNIFTILLIYKYSKYLCFVKKLKIYKYSCGIKILRTNLKKHRRKVSVRRAFIYTFDCSRLTQKHGELLQIKRQLFHTELYRALLCKFSQYKILSKWILRNLRNKLSRNSGIFTRNCNSRVFQEM